MWGERACVRACLNAVVQRVASRGMTLLLMLRSYEALGAHVPARASLTHTHKSYPPVHTQNQ